METLPPELVGLIAERLGAQDAARLREVSRSLRDKLDSKRGRKWAREVPTKLKRDAFQKACIWQDNTTAKWLASVFALTGDDARSFDDHALRSVCTDGNLEMAQWLVATFKLTAGDARACDNWALRGACANGHLHVVQWLVAEFGLTCDDARADNNFALHRARANGHLAVAQWLRETFGLTLA